VAPSEELPESDYRDTLDLNLNGYFVLSQDVARGMLARGSGAIINISSIFGLVRCPSAWAYCVSKAALNMMTKVMAIEWAARGVRVNAIAPGYVETSSSVPHRARRPRSHQARPAHAHGPAGQFRRDRGGGALPGHPRRLLITGEILTVDGGWSSYGFL
jgi:NAD(P)-dependent dehydrogenase (short-subunit alcohol dehydrogenase family)